NHITQNVASVPFLWVLPLALYLASFILAFDHPRWYVRALFIVALLALLPAMAFYVPSLNLHVAVPLYLVGLFVSCMFCHGELARLRPDPLHLTRYYLMVSLGGALGAVLVAILAPLALPGYFELGIALVALALLMTSRLRKILVWGGAAVTIAVALLVARGVHNYSAGVRVMERDFYGVVRTADHDSPIPYRSMYHGPIMHGGQLLGDSFRNTPADYFSPTSGYGRVFQSLREMRPKQPLSVGILGLGAGVVAAWMRPGDALVFYAISLLAPVRRLAGDFGMQAVNGADVPDDREGPEYWYSSSDQIIVTRNKALLTWPRIAEAAEPIEDRRDLPTFTDSHYNLLRILK